MKRYTKEEIEQYSRNPNVKLITEEKMVLTYEFRLILYEEWEKSPVNNTIRRMLNENGIDAKKCGKDFVKDIAKEFRRHGKPRNGKKRISVNFKSSDSDNEKLLETGKFVRRSNGIGFAADFEEELHAKYPEQTIEEGLKEVGIDPQTVGYQRIYMLEQRFKGIKPPSSGIQRRSEYTEDEIAVIEAHPYVEKITAKQLLFHGNLYCEASALIQAGYTIEDVMGIFDIPEEWLSHSKKWLMYYKIKHAELIDQETEPNMTEWTPEKKAKYAEIQWNRIEALENIVSNEFVSLKETVRTMNLLQKKHVCEWIRDDLLLKTPMRNGEFSLPNVLKLAGISRSVYYRLLKDDTIEEKMETRKAREKEDMDLVRQVIEYGGYPKGSRQIYMQMPLLTGKKMGRKKIIKLRRKMNLKCSVRKPNPSRQLARKRLANHVKPNLLQRRFKLFRPGKAILTDVTYLKYCHGKKLAYGSASIDAVTGRLYEMDVSEYNDVELVVQMVRALPCPDKDAERSEKPLLHSDQGSQYLSDEYQELLIELGFIQSMSKRGNCWDNAPQESFFGHFKDEVAYVNLETIDDLRNELARYKTYYNEVRGQWNRGRMTPLQREAWINNLSSSEYAEWQKKEKEQYEDMKRKSREKAIERSKTLGV